MAWHFRPRLTTVIRVFQTRSKINFLIDRSFIELFGQSSCFAANEIYLMQSASELCHNALPAYFLENSILASWALGQQDRQIWVNDNLVFLFAVLTTIYEYPLYTNKLRQSHLALSFQSFLMMCIKLRPQPTVSS